MIAYDFASTATLEGLVVLTNDDIGDMSDLSVKQMLMDLRGLTFIADLSKIHMFHGLDNLNNEQISRLGHEEAVTMLTDLRDITRRLS